MPVTTRVRAKVRIASFMGVTSGVYLRNQIKLLLGLSIPQHIQ